MLNLFKLFRRRPIEVGSRWVLKGESTNPFRNRIECVVTAVQDGWVQYRWVERGQPAVLFGSPNSKSVYWFRVSWKRL